jgi:nitric oxide reductase large subunit
MKKLLFTAIFAFVCTWISAQTLKDEVAYVQQIWGKDKKALVNEVLKLNTEEGNKFWPLYDAYQTERMKIGQERVAAIKGYADNYNNMTDDKAKDLAMQLLKNNHVLNKLQKSYLKKMSKNVSGIRAVQFLQLETYIDNMLKAAISDELPFMPDPKK